MSCFIARTIRVLVLSIVALGSFLCLSNPLDAGTIYTWNTTTGDWTQTAKWDSGGPGSTYPGTTDTATFADNGGGTVSLNGNQTADTLTFNNNAGNDYTVAGTGSGDVLTLETALNQTGTGNNLISAILSATNLTGSVSSGTLHLSNTSNSITGTSSFAVSGGTLRAAVKTGGNALGSASIDLSGGTLQLDPEASTSTPGFNTTWSVIDTTAITGNNTQTKQVDYSGAAGSITQPASSFWGNNVDYNITTPGNAAFYTSGPVDNYGIRWQGTLKVTTPGLTQFSVISDDSNRLYIDGQAVILNDGSHGLNKVAGAINLTAGLHDIRLDYAQGTGSSGARLYWTPFGGQEAILPVASAIVNSDPINAGNGVTLSGSATSAINLNGGNFTTVVMGNLSAGAGNTLQVTGLAGKLLRFGNTTLAAGTTTIDTAPETALGHVDDGSAGAVTLVKQGTGRLIFDHTATANAMGNTTIDIQQGDVLAIGRYGANSPMGTATVQINGGNLQLDSAYGPPAFDNAVSVVADGGIRTFVSTMNMDVGGTMTSVQPSIGNATAGRDINIAANKILFIDQTNNRFNTGGSSLLLAGNLTGSGYLVQTAYTGAGNSGTLWLGGNNAGFGGTLTNYIGTVRAIAANAVFGSWYSQPNTGTTLRTDVAGGIVGPVNIPVGQLYLADNAGISGNTTTNKAYIGPAGSALRFITNESVGSTYFDVADNATNTLELRGNVTNTVFGNFINMLKAPNTVVVSVDQDATGSAQTLSITDWQIGAAQILEARSGNSYKFGVLGNTTLIGTGNGTTSVFGIVGNATDLVFNGKVQESNGSVIISKTGTGELQLNNAANSFSGGLMVIAGAVSSNVAAVLPGNTIGTPFGTGPIKVLPGGMLRLGSYQNVVTGQITLASGARDLTAIGFTGAADATPPPFTVGAFPGVFTLAGGTFNALPLNLAALGDGKLFLGAAGGNATYQATTLGVGSGSTYRLGGGGGNVTLTIGNVITGTGAKVLVGPPQNMFYFPQFGNMPISGDSIVVIGNTNNYTGTTTVNRNNTLAFSVGTANTPLGTGAVTVYGSLVAFGANGSFKGSTGTTNRNAITLGQSGAIVLDSRKGYGGLSGGTNTDRWGDTATLTMDAGTLSLYGASNAAGNETMGTLTFNRGGNAINLVRAGTGSTYLTVGGWVRATTAPNQRATVVISTGSDTTTLGTTNKLRVSSGAPVVTNGMVLPWMVNGTDNTFLNYNAATTVASFVNLASYSKTNTFVYPGTGVDTVDINTTTTLTAASSIYALRTSADIANAGYTLTLQSGGLIAAPNAGKSTANAANLSFGTGGNGEGLIYVAAGQTLNQTGGVVTTTTGSLTKFGPGDLSLQSATNDIRGNITVNSGRLILTGSQNISSLTNSPQSVVLQSGAELRNTASGDKNMRGNNTNRLRLVVAGDSMISFLRESGTSTNRETTADTLQMGTVLGDMRTLTVQGQNSFGYQIYSTTTLYGDSTFNIDSGTLRTYDGRLRFRGTVTMAAGGPAAGYAIIKKGPGQLVFGTQSTDGTYTTKISSITVDQGIVLSANQQTTARPYGSASITVNPGAAISFFQNEHAQGAVNLYSDANALALMEISYNPPGGTGAIVPATFNTSYVPVGQPVGVLAIGTTMSVEPKVGGTGIFSGKMLFMGVVNNYTYSAGSLTPGYNNAYYLGGGVADRGLTISGSALTGANSVVIGAARPDGSTYTLGSSMVILSNVNNYTGNGSGAPTTINAGTLRIQAVAGYGLAGAGTGAIMINNGSTLQLYSNTSTTVVNPIYFGTGTTATVGTVNINRIAAPARNQWITFNGDFVLPTGKSVTFTSGQNYEFVVNGNLVISGTGQRSTVGGAGVMHLNGKLDYGTDNILSTGMGSLLLSSPASGTGSTVLTGGMLSLSNVNQVASGNLANTGGSLVWENAGSSGAEIFGGAWTFGTGNNQVFLANSTSATLAARGNPVTISSATADSTTFDRSFGLGNANLVGTAPGVRSTWANAPITITVPTTLTANRTIRAAANGNGINGTGGFAQTLAGAFTGPGSLAFRTTGTMASSPTLGLGSNTTDPSLNAAQVSEVVVNAGVLAYTGSPSAAFATNAAGFNAGPGGVLLWGDTATDYEDTGGFLRFASPSALPTSNSGAIAYLARIARNTGTAGGAPMLGGFLLSGNGVGNTTDVTYTFSAGQHPGYKFVIGGVGGNETSGILGSTNGAVVLEGAQVAIHQVDTLGLVARDGTLKLGTGSGLTTAVKFEASVGNNTTVGGSNNTIQEGTTVLSDASTSLVANIVKRGVGTVVLDNVAYTKVDGSTASAITGWNWLIGAGNATINGGYFEGAVRETGTGSAQAVFIRNSSTIGVKMQGGVLELGASGLDSAAPYIGNGAGFIDMSGTGGGGFAAFGGARTVQIDDGYGGPVTLAWGGDGNTAGWVAGAAGSAQPLIFGSTTADNTLTLTNPIDLFGNETLQPAQTIRTVRGVGTAPEGELSGLIQSPLGNIGLTFDGYLGTQPGSVILSNANTYTGKTIINAGTVIAADSTALGGATSAILLGNNLLDGNDILVGRYTPNNWDAGLLTGNTTGVTISRPIIVQAGGTGNITIGGSTADTTTFSGNITLGSATVIRTISAGNILITAGAVTAKDVDLAAVGNGTVTFSGNIVDASSLVSAKVTKIGAGTVLLSGANKYKGGTVVAEGTLELGANNTLPTRGSVTLGAGSSSGILRLAGYNQILAGLATAGSGTDNAVVNGSSTVSSFTIASSGNTTFGGTLGGPGSNEDNFDLVKAGGGALTLTGNNTYTGNTTINAGTLALDFTVRNGSKISSANPLIVAGGTLSVIGNADEDTTQNVNGITVNSGSSALSVTAPGGRTTLLDLYQSGGGTLTRTGGTLNFIFGGAGTPQILFPGTADTMIGGWATVDDNWAYRDANNFVTTFTGYNNEDDPGLWAEYDNPQEVSGYTGNTVAPGNINTLKFNASSDNTVNIGSNSTLKITGSGILVAAGAGNKTIAGGNLTGSADGDLIIVQNNTSGTLSISSVITDDAAIKLTKAGPGTLILNSGANTYTGPTEINGGVLEVGVLDNGGSNSDIGASSNASSNLAFNTGTLRYTGGNVSIDRGFTLNVGGGTIDVTTGATELAMSGTAVDGGGGGGALTKAGPGTLTLSASNTYTSATHINGGILSVATLDIGGNPSGIGQSSNDLANLTFNGGTLKYTGSTVVSDRDFTLEAGGGTIDTANDLTIGSGTGPGGLTKAGTGILTVGGANDYLGNTTIADGALQLSTNDNALPTTGTLTLGAVVSGGDTSGKLILNNFNQTLAGLLTVGTGTDNRVINTTASSQPVMLTINNAGNTTFGGILGNVTADENTFGLTKTGAGILTLNSGGTSSYSGATQILGGTVSIAVFGNAGYSTDLGAAYQGSEYLVLKGATLQYTGNTVITDHGMTLDGGTSGTLLGTVEVSTAATNLTFTYNEGDPYYIVGTGGLVKTGNGTLTLNSGGSNAYSGATWINGGTLSVAVLGNAATGGAPSDIGTSSNNGINLNFTGGTLKYTGSTVITDRDYRIFDGGATFDVTQSGATLTVGAGAQGANTTTGDFTKRGPGSLIVTGNVRFPGNNTYIKNGTLILQGGNNRLPPESGAKPATVVTLGEDLGGSGDTAAVLKIRENSQPVSGLYIAGTKGAANRVAAGMAQAGGSGTLIINLANGVTDTFGGILGRDPNAYEPNDDRFALEKGGPGTLVLTQANTYNTGTTVSEGILHLSGGNNRLPIIGNVNLGGSNKNATLWLDGGNQTVGGLLTPGGATGVIQVINGNANTVTLTVNNGGTNAYDGRLGGNGTNDDNFNLVKSNSSTLTLSGTNTFTGATTVNAGTLALDYTIRNTNKISSTSPLYLGGGTLSMTGFDSGNTSQTVGNVTFRLGNSGITLNPGNTTTGNSTTYLDLGNITRNVGATVNFTLGGNIITGNNTTTVHGNGTYVAGGLLGGWATYGGNTWAVTVPASSFTIGNLAAYNNDSYTSTDNTDVTKQPAAFGSAITVNSLRFNTRIPVTLTLAAGNNTISSGGILVTSAVSACSNIITGGSLVGPSGSDLVVINNDTTYGSSLTINSTLVDNSTSSLTKSGGGTLILGGTNTYTGSTNLNGGVLSVALLANGGANSGIGAAPATAGNLNFNGGTLQYTGASVTVNRNITVYGSGNATLDVVNAATTLTWTGDLTAATASGGFAKSGAGTLLLKGNNTGLVLPGNTTINAGTLNLDYTTSNTNKISTTGTLNINGATLLINGSAAGSTTQNTDVLRVATGQSSIQVYRGGSNAASLNVRRITRPAGGTIDFVLGTGSTSITTVEPNGAAGNTILGPWATVGGKTWAVTGTGGGVYNISGLSDGAYAADDFTGGNVNVDVLTNQLTPSAFTISSLRFNSPAGVTAPGAITLTLAGTNTIGIGGGSANDGGILVTSSVGNNSITISGGTLRSGQNADLVIIQNNTAANGWLRIDSVLANQGTTTLTKAGGGLLYLGGNNTYTGATFLTGGTIQLVNGLGFLPATTVLNMGYGSNSGKLVLDGNSQTLAGLSTSGVGATNRVVNGNAGSNYATLTVNNSSDYTFYGILGTSGNAMDNNFGLTKKSTGTLTLRALTNYSGTGVSFYTGKTLIEEGILSFDSIANAAVVTGTALGAPGVSANSTIDIGNVTALTTGTLRYNGTVSAGHTTDRVVNLLNGGTIDASGAGPLTMQLAGSIVTGTGNLTLQGAGFGVMNGVIAIGNSTVTSSVTKSGSGTWTIGAGGNNTYYGPTNLNGGTLSIAVLPNGGVVGPIGQSTSDAGNLTFNGGSLQYTGGNVTNDRNFTLTGTGTFDVADGNTTLTLNGYGIGGGNLNKAGLGTLVLNGVHAYTGSTGIQVGTVILGGENRLPLGTTVTLGNIVSGGTDNAGILVMNNYNQQIGGLASSGNATNRVVNRGASTVTLTISGSGNNTYGGVLGGPGTNENNFELVKRGAGIQALTAVSTYTGNTTINGGTLSVDFSVDNTADKIPSTTTLNLAGGTIGMVANLTLASSQTFASGVNLTYGDSGVSLTSGNTTGATLVLGNINRTLGSTLDFTLPVAGNGSVTTTTGNGYGNILGGYATVGSTTWAVSGTGGGPYTVSALPDGNYTTDSWSAGNDTNVTTSGTVAGSSTTNSLRFNVPYPIVLSLSGNNVISSGGLLITPNVGANGITLNGGTIIGPSSADLVLLQKGTGTLTINSSIGDSPAVALTKSGVGIVILGANNSYTGGTIVNGGTLQLGGNELLADSGNLTVNGGTFNLGGYTETLGAVLIKGGSISGGTLIGSSYEMQAGTISSVLAGTAGLKKTIVGQTATLSGASTYSGATEIWAGTLSLGTGNNRLPISTTLTLGNLTNSGVLRLNSRSQELAGLVTSGTGTANRVINDNTTAAALTLNIASGNNVFDGILGGVNSDQSNFSLVKAGAGTLTLTGANTFSLETTVNGGTLLLDYSSQNNNKISATGNLNMGGGTVTINANSSGSQQSVLGLNVLPGASAIGVTSSNAATALNLGNITRSTVGGTVDFSLPVAGNITTTTVNTNDIIGGYATVGGADWATGTGAGPAFNIAALPIGNYTTLSTGPADDTLNSTLTDGQTQVGAVSTNSLKISTTTGSQSLDLGDGFSLALKSGGLLFVGGDDFSITGNVANTTLGAADSELIVFANGAGNLTIGVPISGNTGSLTKSGAGMVILTTANTYTGITNLNAGTLRLSGGNNTIKDSNDVTVAGGATLDLQGNSQVLNALSGAGTIEGASGTPLLTVGNNNGSSTFSGLIQNTSGSLALVKAGTGTVTLSGANTYTGKTIIAAGTLTVTSIENVGGPANSLGQPVLADSGIDLGAVVGNTSTSGRLQYSGTLAGGHTTDRAINLVTAGTIGASGVGPLTVAGSVTGNNVGLTLRGTGMGVMVNPISLGTGRLTKSDAGTWTLTSGNNLYSGATNVNGGVLVVNTLDIGGNASAIGSSSNDAGNLTFDGGTLQYTGGNVTTDRSFTLNSGSGTFDVLNASTVLTLTGAGQGSGGLGKVGLGTLILSGAHSYSGNTTIQNGLVQLVGGNDLLPFSTTVTLGSGITSGVLKLNGNSQEIAGLASSGTGYNNRLVNGAGTSVILTISGSGNNAFSGYLGGAGSNENDFALVKAGSGVETLTSANTYSGNTTINGGTLGVDFSVDNSANKIPATSVVNIGGGTLVMTANPTFASSQTVNGVNINVGASGIVLNAGTLSSGTLALGNLTRTVGGTVEFTLPLSANGNITTATANTASGNILAGYATAGNATWAVATAIGGGVYNINPLPEVGYGNDTWAAGTETTVTVSGNVADGLTTNSLRFNTADLTGGPAANVTLTLLGTGNIATGGLLVTPYVGNYTVTINGGTLRGAAGADLVVIDNNPVGSLRINSEIADGSTNALTKAGVGLLVIGGNNTYTGGTYINAGTLQLAASERLADTGAVTIGGGSVFDLQTFNETVGAVTLGDGQILGSGTLTGSSYDVRNGTIGAGLGGNETVALTKTTRGTVALIGPATYTGGTFVNAGTLQIANNNRLADTGNVTVAGGTLDLLNFSDIVGNVTLTSGNIIGTGTATLTSTGTNDFQVQSGLISARLAGNVALTKTGTGTVTLSASGNNTYTGLTDVQAGTLELNATSTGTVGGSVPGNLSITGNATVRMLRSNQITDSGTVTVNTGLFDIQGNSDTVAGVTLVSGAIDGSGGTLTSTTDFAVQAGSASANLGGNVGLTKTTGSLVTLSGTNSYTGATNVNDGVLLVNGSLSESSAVTVGNLATLGGNGTIGGPITVNAGGTLSPGASAATLSLSGNVTLTPSATFKTEIQGLTAGLEYDQLKLVAGTVEPNPNATITDSILNAQFSVWTPTPGQPDLSFRFWIMDNTTAGALVGTFSGLPNDALVANYGGYQWVVRYNVNAEGNDIGPGTGNDIVITNVPEPSVFVLLGSLAVMGLAGLVWKRRRQGRA